MNNAIYEYIDWAKVKPQECYSKLKKQSYVDLNTTKQLVSDFNKL